MQVDRSEQAPGQDGALVEVAEHTFLRPADAAVPLAEISARLGHEFDDGNSESLGGLIVQRAGRGPEVGDKVTLDGFTFIVREADETRVVKVEIDTARVQSMP